MPQDSRAGFDALQSSSKRSCQHNVPEILAVQHMHCEVREYAPQCDQRTHPFNTCPATAFLCNNTLATRPEDELWKYEQLCIPVMQYTLRTVNHQR